MSSSENCLATGCDFFLRITLLVSEIALGRDIRLVHRGIHGDRSNKQYDFGRRPLLFQLPELLSEWYKRRFSAFCRSFAACVVYQADFRQRLACLKPERFQPLRKIAVERFGKPEE